jgi:hypothetical protein
MNAAAERLEWERSVARLPAEDQAKAVAARLQKLNPNFDGTIETTIEQGLVTSVTFPSDQVSDLSPIRALTALVSLDCSGTDAFSGQRVYTATEGGGRVEIRTVGKGKLADLSPLKGLALTNLNCTNTEVADLSPLKGMKLISLSCGATRVSDLAPLEGMPLDYLDCSYTRVSDLAPLHGMQLTLGYFGPEVSDLTPLKGMPLTRLLIGKGVSDLTPLKGMPLQELECAGSAVSDLSPLHGMPLAILGCSDTKVTDVKSLAGMANLRRLWCCDLVSDLTPLKGLPLEYLHAGPLVTDVSPLKGMPLNQLEFKSFQWERDGDALRSIKSLEEINGVPAAEFWKEIDATNAR